MHKQTENIPCIRPANITDIDSLVGIEQSCFTTDRISRRQFRYLLNKANASILVITINGNIKGDVVILYSRATSIARLYSIALLESVRGQGLGQQLIKAAENEAWRHQRAYIRLEVETENHTALSLYKKTGYRVICELNNYYQDRTSAIRMEKSLAPDLHPKLKPVPYFEQSLDFTCGSASLMMAMKTLKPELVLNRKLELRLWREATTIFMTSGHGGCGPYGLALAASKRGFRVKVFVSVKETHLIDSVRSEHKKEVMRLVQDDMHDQLCSLNIPISETAISVDEIEKSLLNDGIPLVLISSWQIYQARVPHWVVVTGTDESFIYVNDPFVDREEGETPVDSIHMPILKEKFETMARYGRVGLQAMVVLHNA